MVAGQQHDLRAEEAMMSASGGAPTGPRVVIVDDDPGTRRALGELLVEGGMRVVGTASDGRQGVETAVALRPDVVVMDQRMPVLSGIEATGRLRQLQPSIPVIVCTTDDDVVLRERAVRAGAVAVVVKGGPATVLLDTISRVSGRGDAPTVNAGIGDQA